MISIDGGVEGICIYPLETIELILPVLVDEYLFCISSQDAFQGVSVRAEKGRGIKEGEEAVRAGQKGAKRRKCKRCDMRVRKR